MNHPLDWEKIDDYIDKMINGVYSQKRAEEFFHALFKAAYKVPFTNLNWIEEIRKEYSS